MFRMIFGDNFVQMRQLVRFKCSRFFGEPVVEACVEGGAHHVDISGEPQYLEKMQLKYHQKALENGVYVVGACGFDSIPADMGQVKKRERNFCGMTISGVCEGRNGG